MEKYTYNAINTFESPTSFVNLKIIIVSVLYEHTYELYMLHVFARTHARTHRNISDGISLYAGRRALFRAALIEKCHGMSEIGKLIHIFSIRANARYRGSRRYFHFACLTREEHNPPPFHVEG